MPFDEGVAERIRDFFLDNNHVVEKKMFGGIAFMLNGNMCCGVVNDTLMARVGPEQYDSVLKKKHAREMDFTGRPMKGFIYVNPPGFETDRQLADWLSLCETFILTLEPK